MKNMAMGTYYMHEKQDRDLLHLKLRFVCFRFCPNSLQLPNENPNASIREISTCFGRTQVVREFLEDFGEKTVVSNKRQRVAWKKRFARERHAKCGCVRCLCHVFFFSEALEQSPSWALDPRTSPRDFEAWKKSFDQKNCRSCLDLLGRCMFGQVAWTMRWSLNADTGCFIAWD